MVPAENILKVEYKASLIRRATTDKNDASLAQSQAQARRPTYLVPYPYPVLLALAVTFVLVPFLISMEMWDRSSSYW